MTDITAALLESVQTRRGHFRMESGHHAALWMDLETLCVRPARVQPFAGELAARLRRYEIDAVCGPLNEGAFVALLVAAALDCPFAYAERFAPDTGQGLFAVNYRVPPALRVLLAGRRVAIVNDVISAGSAVRGAFEDLQTIGAQVVAISSLFVLGGAIDVFAGERGVPVEALARLPFEHWPPAECPLCREGRPVEEAWSG